MTKLFLFKDIKQIVFEQHGNFLLNIYTYIYVNNKIPFKDHVIPQNRQIDKQIVQYERQRIDIYPTK